MGVDTKYQEGKTTGYPNIAVYNGLKNALNHVAQNATKSNHFLGEMEV
jgi:hypothetical protein